jgi:ribosomal protein S3
MVTKQTGKIDCLTVRADAPVKPLLVVVDFLRAAATASAVEGRLCSRRSAMMVQVSGRTGGAEAKREHFGLLDGEMV